MCYSTILAGISALAPIILAGLGFWQVQRAVGSAQEQREMSEKEMKKREEERAKYLAEIEYFKKKIAEKEAEIKERREKLNAN